MKLRLSLSLLTVVVSGFAAAAEDDATKGAFVASPSFSGAVDQYVNHSFYILQNVFDSSTTSNDQPKATVKDGKGAWIFDGSGEAEGNDGKVKTPEMVLYNPLVVREGALKLHDYTLKSLHSTPANFVGFLSVGGTNASLELDNSTIEHYKQKTYEVGGKKYTTSSVSGMILGTADGAATVILNNNSKLHTDHFLHIGDVDGQQYSYTVKNEAGENETIYRDPGTGYVKFTTDSNGNRYVGDYLTKGAEQTVINVNSGSELSSGTAMQIGHAKINIDGDGSIMKNGTTGELNLAYVKMGIDASADIAVKTELNITNGGSFNCTGGLYTSGKGNGNETHISVDGSNSSLTVTGPANLSTGANSSTSIKLTNGGVAYMNEVHLGGNGTATLSIGSGSSVKAVDGIENPTGIIAYDNSSIETAGSIGLDVTVTGGVVTAKTNSEFANLYANSGVLNIEGAVTINGELVLGALTSTFSTEGAADSLTLNINYNGTPITATNGISLGSGLNINVMVDDLDIVGDSFDLFGGIAEYEQLANAKLTFTDGVSTVAASIAETEGGFTVTGTTTIPEPTTATLSLLALAALAARRRRK